MSSSKNPDGSESPVWALLNSLKSRNPTSPTSAEIVDKSMSKPTEIRREAIQEFCNDLDRMVKQGEYNGGRLYSALVTRGRRGKASDNFVADCQAKRVLDSKNSRTFLESTAKSAKGHLAVAGVALRKARRAATDLSIALDKAEN